VVGPLPSLAFAADSHRVRRRTLLASPLLWALACRPAAPPASVGPVEVVEEDVAWHRAAAGAAFERVPDPARGGAPVSPASSPLPPFTGVDRATATYVGPGACEGCHPEVVAAWTGTAHARAWATLERVQASHDPACVRCHVQGLGHPGGFPAAPQLRDVGCEACHGPGSDHVQSAVAGYGDLPRDGSACVACHTADTSPDFRWETRWPSVAHESTARLDGE
jgi:hypothetical protein